MASRTQISRAPFLQRKKELRRSGKHITEEHIYIYIYVPAGREMVPACKGNIIPRIKTHSEEDSLLELVKCNSSMWSLILCKIQYIYMTYFHRTCMHL